MISACPPHGMGPEAAKTVKKLDELFLDFGVCDKQEIEDLGIRVGNGQSELLNGKSLG